VAGYDEGLVNPHCAFVQKLGADGTADTGFGTDGVYQMKDASAHYLRTAVHGTLLAAGYAPDPRRADDRDRAAAGYASGGRFVDPNAESPYCDAP
jgi:hypothetical protein